MMFSALLAFAFYMHAKDWLDLSHDLDVQRSLRASAESHCIGLQKQSKVTQVFLGPAEMFFLKGEARERAATKIRALVACAVSLPTCILSFVGAVHGFARCQSRTSNVAPDLFSYFAMVLFALPALLGLVSSVLVRPSPPSTVAAFVLG